MKSVNSRGGISYTAIFQVMMLGLVGLVMASGTHFNKGQKEILTTTNDYSYEQTDKSEALNVEKTEVASKFATNEGKEVTVEQIEAAQAVATKATAVKSNTQTASKTTPSGSYISILGKNLNIFQTGSTEVDAGSRVARYGSKFLFGHNSGNVFAGLSGVSSFSVTINGATTNYRVSKVATMTKEEASRRMNAMAQGGYNGKYYDLAIMTCAGTNLGGGDATHRTVLFANAV